MENENERGEPANPGSAEKMAVKMARMCVCVCAVNHSKKILKLSNTIPTSTLCAALKKDNKQQKTQVASQTDPVCSESNASTADESCPGHRHPTL